MHMCHLVMHMGISESQNQGGPKGWGLWRRMPLSLYHNPLQHLACAQPQVPWGHQWAVTLQGCKQLQLRDSPHVSA